MSVAAFFDRCSLCPLLYMIISFIRYKKEIDLVSSAYPLLERAMGKGFASPLGLHPRDRDRAKEYFSAAWNAGLKWVDMEVDIREYLAARNAAPEEVEKQLDLARELHRR